MCTGIKKLDNSRFDPTSVSSYNRLMFKVIEIIKGIVNNIIIIHSYIQHTHLPGRLLDYSLASVIRKVL